MAAGVVECADLLLIDHNPQEADDGIVNTTPRSHHRDSGVDDDISSGHLLRPGQIERLESRRGLNENQSRVIRDRRKSFIVEFSQMNGPPQIALLMATLAIGYGCTMGVTPAIMSDRFARINHGYDGVACDSFSSQDEKPNECFLGNADAQAAASISNLISNTFTFCTASLMGSLSDEYGRKGFLLLGLLIGMIPSFFLFLIQYIPTMNPWWYYTASSITGLVSWAAIALSALNDVLPREFRGPGIGLLFAGFLFGISLAPTLSLFLKRTQLTIVSFIVIAFGFIMTCLFVPETLKPQVAQETKRRRILREKRWLGQTIKLIIFRPIHEMSILNRNNFFRLISALAFFTGMVQSGDQVLLLYYLEDQLSFNQKDIAVMFLTIGITGIIVQVFIMKPLNDRVGEKMVIAISFMCGSIVNFLYGFASHKSTIFCALILSGFNGMSFPTISAIKANNVHESEQGRIQGALYSIKALASGVGPAAMQFVYSKTKDMNHKSGSFFGPGTMWYFASFLFIIAVGLTLILPNDKANTSIRHGGGDGTDIDGDDEAGDTTGTVIIDDNDLEEYHELASGGSLSSSSSEHSDYGTI
ncbi:MFS general substrate transporter [Fragilariopsis cylindrus CCMP1102]|uniref:MFS general substrate transporter n=1 Tax=Fragilariopsis cylindrus CCMP1102 TaxID=635003 RepID=A0A1E7ERY7_9STRA|nr:MFS general substrate transporter [Fragilariopsis cylindrus CCMP1102]|eukprot:OEU08564.1 MFS general substrate transporter [Fragilariopsis cylindrus CCMP1102]